MTDKIQTLQPKRERYLLERPQPLGILPTRWFWNERENWREVGWMFGLLAMGTVMLLSFISLPPLASVLLAPSVIILANGLLERYIRRKALERREALPKALRGADGESA
ncbi:MAG: hypothetical protein R6X02_10460 [Enhygromyxa sp.]